MRSIDLTIAPLTSPDVLHGLAEDAKTDGRAIVERFIEEWAIGKNRFSLPGERAYVARLGGRICGVCGLNRDPFTGDTAIGRVRRLYVSVADRRAGIGTALVDRLISDAREIFHWLHLRTHDPDAAAFYEAIGFQRVVGSDEFTHRFRVLA